MFYWHFTEAQFRSLSPVHYRLRPRREKSWFAKKYRPLLKRVFNIMIYILIKFPLILKVNTSSIFSILNTAGSYLWKLKICAKRLHGWQWCKQSCCSGWAEKNMSKKKQNLIWIYFFVNSALNIVSIWPVRWVQAC